MSKQFLWGLVGMAANVSGVDKIRVERAIAMWPQHRTTFQSQFANRPDAADKAALYCFLSIAQVTRGRVFVMLLGNALALSLGQPPEELSAIFSKMCEGVDHLTSVAKRLGQLHSGMSEYAHTHVVLMCVTKIALASTNRDDTDTDDLACTATLLITPATMLASQFRELEVSPDG